MKSEEYLKMLFRNIFQTKFQYLSSFQKYFPFVNSAYDLFMENSINNTTLNSCKSNYIGSVHTIVKLQYLPKLCFMHKRLYTI